MQPPKESFDNQRVENRDAQCECNTYKKHFKKKEALNASYYYSRKLLGYPGRIL